jgi:hypothetical protein
VSGDGSALLVRQPAPFSERRAVMRKARREPLRHKEGACFHMVICGSSISVRLLGTRERASGTMSGRSWDDPGTILGRSLPALQGRQEVRKLLCRQRKFLMRDDGVDHDDLFAAIQGANGHV